MLDDELLDVDLDAVIEAIRSTNPQPTTLPIEDLPRIDVFSTHRSPFDGAIYGCAYPWSFPGADIIDYYRTEGGWLIFLERTRASLVVRLRHENQLTEPSITKQGVTLTWWRDRANFQRIQDLILLATAEGRSPLYDLVLANKLPDFLANPLRERLPAPLDTSFTVTGDVLFPARQEILQHLVQKTIYTRRPA